MSKRTKSFVVQQLALPPHQYSERGEPMWCMMLPIIVRRTDHSVGIMQYAGTVSAHGADRYADVSVALGGYAYILHPVKYNGKGGASFAVELRETLESIAHLIPLMGEAAEGAWPKKDPKTGNRKRMTKRQAAQVALVRSWFELARAHDSDIRLAARKKLEGRGLIRRTGRGVATYWSITLLGRDYIQEHKIDGRLFPPKLRKKR